MTQDNFATHAPIWG